MLTENIPFEMKHIITLPYPGPLERSKTDSFYISHRFAEILSRAQLDLAQMITLGTV